MKWLKQLECLRALLLLETKFLTSKSCNGLWKKSMHEHMWLILAVPTCNYFFDFLLNFWHWKPLTPMLLMSGFSFQGPENYYIMPLHTYIHTYILIHIYTIYIMVVHPSKHFKPFYPVQFVNQVGKITKNNIFCYFKLHIYTYI